MKIDQPSDHSPLLAFCIIRIMNGKVEEISPCETPSSSLELRVVCGDVSLSSTSVEKGPERKSLKVYLILEILVLSAIVLILLAISMLPTIFFIHPPLNFQPVSRHTSQQVCMSSFEFHCRVSSRGGGGVLNCLVAVTIGYLCLQFGVSLYKCDGTDSSTDNYR